MKAETLIDADRLRVIRKLCHLAESIPGDAIEVGVYKGGSLREIALNLPHKLVWGFDTFEGLPQSGWKEGEILSVGQFAVSMEEVEASLRPEIPNFKLVKGVFPQRKLLVKDSQEMWVKFGDDPPDYPTRVCLAHLDVDYGKSIIECLDWLASISCPFIVIDDYGWKDCPHVKPAVDNWLYQRSYVIHTPVPQQCWLQKL